MFAALERDPKDDDGNRSLRRRKSTTSTVCELELRGFHTEIATQVGLAARNKTTSSASCRYHTLQVMQTSRAASYKKAYADRYPNDVLRKLLSLYVSSTAIFKCFGLRFIVSSVLLLAVVVVVVVAVVVVVVVVVVSSSISSSR